MRKLLAALLAISMCLGVFSLAGQAAEPQGEDFSFDIDHRGEGVAEGISVGDIEFLGEDTTHSPPNRKWDLKFEITVESDDLALNGIEFNGFRSETNHVPWSSVTLNSVEAGGIGYVTQGSYLAFIYPQSSWRGVYQVFLSVFNNQVESMADLEGTSIRLYTSSSAPLTFDDSAFEAAVRESCDKPTGAIGPADAKNVRNITWEGFGDLTENDLQQLDKMFVLGDFRCSYSDFTRLVFRDFRYLDYLSLNNNPRLESLVVTGCPVLTRLDAQRSGNLTALTVNGVPSLAYMYIGQNSISALDISDCPALLDLHCSSNRLESLDVSANLQLQDLRFDNNALRSIDVSRNSELRNLQCSTNLLTQLDVSNNPLLNHLACDGNKIDSLDLAHNPLLNSLVVGHPVDYMRMVFALYPGEDYAFPDWETRGFGNLLTELDLSQNPLLTYLSCAGNLLTELDLSANPLLSTLMCAENQLTSLDISGQPDLNILFCEGNDLAALDISGSPGISTLWVQNNRMPSFDAIAGLEGSQAWQLMQDGIEVLPSYEPADPDVLFWFYPQRGPTYFPDPGTGVEAETDDDVFPPGTVMTVTELGAGNFVLGPGNSVHAVYDIKFIKDNEVVQPDGKVTVRLPFKDVSPGTSANWKVYYVERDTQGNITNKVNMNAKVVQIDGVYYWEFEADHFSVYAVVDEASAETHFWDCWPCRAQWILKYILFGWLWMRWF